MGADRRAHRRRARPIHACATARVTAASSVSAHGMALELLQYVPLDDPIKISRLKITQHLKAHAQALPSRRTRSGCWAPRAAPAAPFIVTELDPQTGALFAINPWNTMFRGRSCVCGSRRPADALDRRPARVSRAPRHARTPGRARTARSRCQGAWARGSIPAPPCSARCVSSRSEVEVVFFLGAGRQRRAMRRRSCARYRAADLDAGAARSRRISGTRRSPRCR